MNHERPAPGSRVHKRGWWLCALIALPFAVFAQAPAQRADRIFDPADEPDEDEDPDLAFIDRLDTSLVTPQPGRPNPEPDPPENPGDGEDEPLDDEDREERKPGRD